jgi:hypothetical protein
MLASSVSRDFKSRGFITLLSWGSCLGHCRPHNVFIDVKHHTSLIILEKYYDQR